MKVSGFTFLRNAQLLGYPFIASIQSILPIVDEFVISLGPCEDETEKMIQDIGDDRIRIIHTQWNENMQTKGFVYGQQKSIALFNCTGDWAFYLEGDEVIHEDDVSNIRTAMENNLHDKNVEALVFDFIHFYGNNNTYAWSPAWYRREARIIRNNVRSFAVDGLYFLVMAQNRKARYPRAALANARIFHYGWVRNEKQMNLKIEHVGKYWESAITAEINYADVDGAILKEFRGTHPKVVHNWFPASEGVFKADPHHTLTSRERKHRISLMIEQLLGIDLTKKHYKLVK